MNSPNDRQMRVTEPVFRDRTRKVCVLCRKEASAVKDQKCECGSMTFVFETVREGLFARNKRKLK